MKLLQPWKRQQVCEALQEHNRRDGSKASNPPNVPQLRPVERFLGSPKQAVYAGSWEASNIDQPKKRDHLKVKNIDVGLLRNAFLGLMTKVRHATDNGVFDCLVNSSPFSQGNTVCTYHFFFFLSAPYHY